MRLRWPQPMAAPIFSLGGVANTAKQIEIRYHEPGRFPSLCRSGLFMWFWMTNSRTKGGIFINIATSLPVKLAEPYKKDIGKVTFQVSSFGNVQGKNTAQQLIIQMLESKVKREKMTTASDFSFWPAEISAWMRYNKGGWKPESVVGKDGYGKVKTTDQNYRFILQTQQRRWI